ncbi:YheC/YheD family protein [Bacillus sp. Marseille-Q1617]|uniref:YheC/YheD family protein n=1 Tax=Bacillus sp. Marseille-Q1617 TaxID=2736887 RepID=UPI001589D1F2|nr:YheC/YheD family protein [Bacillus sp. Marseille-Q1617]
MKEPYFCSVHLDKELDPLYIYLNEETLKQLNIESNSIILNFGHFKKELMIGIVHNLQLNQMKLSSCLNENLSIPDLPYDSYFIENQLFLGPVIGFLETPWFNPKQETAKLRFSNYDTIKGLIYIFNSKTIDQSTKTISGYYYEPTANRLIKGTFPYPCAIYNRSPMNPNLYKHFKEHIGEKIFNYPYRNDNKYSFWINMSKIPYIREHLPFTRRYKGVESLLHMLTKYESVFLKPTSLSRGRGIFHIKKADEGYILSSITGDKVLIESIETLDERLQSSIMKKSRYIIQREIPFTHSGKKIDFRLYLQKDETKNWKYSGMETKVAMVGSVISNSSNREKVLPGEAALKEIYHLSEDQMKQKIVEITQLCMSILSVMESDEETHLGDVAFDFILDSECKVWVLEMQPNYAAERKAKRTMDERRVLPYILPTPFEYAKVLAGF